MPPTGFPKGWYPFSRKTLHFLRWRVYQVSNETGSENDTSILSTATHTPKPNINPSGSKLHCIRASSSTRKGRSIAIRFRLFDNTSLRSRTIRLERKPSLLSRELSFHATWQGVQSDLVVSHSVDALDNVDLASVWPLPL